MHTDQHPKISYATDADVVNASKEHRKALSNLIRQFCNIEKDTRSGIFTEIVPVLKDFDKLPEDYDDDPMKFVRDYCCRQMYKGNLSGIIPVFLGWLCAFHQEAAIEFYRKTDLATEGMKFRPYPKRPGSWTEPSNRNKTKNNNDIVPAENFQENLAPLIPFISALTSYEAPYFTPDAPIRFPHPGGVIFADFSTCGRYIVVAGRYRHGYTPGAYIWSVKQITAQDRCHMISLGAEGDVQTATFSPDSRFVIWVTNRKAKLSYVHARTHPIFEIEHANKISYCSFSKSKNLIATSSWDQTACIWDAKSGRKLSTISPKIRGDHVVNSAYISRDGTKLLIACSDCTIGIWDIATRANLSLFLSIKNDWVCGAIFSRDESSILTAGPESGGAYIWDVASKNVKWRFGRDEAHKDTVVSAYFSPNEKFILTASEDGCAFVWSIKSQSIVMRLPHPAKVLVAHFSPCGSQILTACDDGFVYLWNVSNLR